MKTIMLIILTFISINAFAQNKQLESLKNQAQTSFKDHFTIQNKEIDFKIDTIARIDYNKDGVDELILLLTPIDITTAGNNFFELFYYNKLYVVFKDELHPKLSLFINNHYNVLGRALSSNIEFIGDTINITNASGLRWSDLIKYNIAYTNNNFELLQYNLQSSGHMSGTTYSYNFKTFEGRRGYSRLFHYLHVYDCNYDTLLYPNHYDEVAIFDEVNFKILPSINKTYRSERKQNLNGLRIDHKAIINSYWDDQNIYLEFSIAGLSDTTDLILDLFLDKSPELVYIHQTINKNDKLEKVCIINKSINDSTILNIKVFPGENNYHSNDAFDISTMGIIKGSSVDFNLRLPLHLFPNLMNEQNESNEYKTIGFFAKITQADNLVTHTLVNQDVAEVEPFEFGKIILIENSFEFNRFYKNLEKFRKEINFIKIKFK